MGLAIVLAVSFFVVRAGEDAEWKLINFLIIVGSTGLGIAAALIIERLVEFPENFPGTLTLIIGMFSALIGCFIAGAWNYWRSGENCKGKKDRGVKNDKTLV